MDTSTSLDTIGERIRFAREGAIPKLSQAELGRRLKVSAAAVAQWENKKKPKHPDSHRIAAIAAVLGVRAEWLITGKGEIPAAPEAAPISGTALDRPLLYRVIVALERYFVDQGQDMTPEDKGETVLAVYDWAAAEGAPGQIDINRISSLLRLAHPSSASRKR